MRLYLPETSLKINLRFVLPDCDSLKRHRTPHISSTAPQLATPMLCPIDPQLNIRRYSSSHTQLWPTDWKVCRVNCENLLRTNWKEVNKTGWHVQMCKGTQHSSLFYGRVSIFVKFDISDSDISWLVLKIRCEATCMTSRLPAVSWYCAAHAQLSLALSLFTLV